MSQVVLLCLFRLLWINLSLLTRGFSPVPAKLVAQIVASKYVDLNELLVVNLVQRDPELQLLLDGRLVLRQRRRIEDIASCGWRPSPFFR